MMPTMSGCEIVWPWPMGSAPSSKARWRMRGGTNSARGTACIAARTRGSSTTSATRASISSLVAGMRGGMAALQRALHGLGETAGETDRRGDVLDGGVLESADGAELAQQGALA